jgi:hypothetical protein
MDNKAYMFDANTITLYEGVLRNLPLDELRNSDYADLSTEMNTAQYKLWLALTEEERTAVASSVRAGKPVWISVIFTL